MSPIDLHSLAQTLIDEARTHHSGRQASSFHGAPGGSLTQIVLALVKGRSLSEHENPGQATLQVIVGRVTLATSERTYALDAGDFMVIPHQRHDLVAVEDSAVVLTVVMER
jgi:quercetin dioxygenase-like cupin family protein